MTSKRRSEEIQQMFASINPRSQRTALLIAHKFGRRFAFRYISRVYNEGQQTIIPPQNNVLIRIFHSIRSLFTSDDSEDDSRSLKVRLI